ncbi:MAG: radical SAM protein, partial [Candidatus Omnitrophota bacterium]
TPNKWIEDLDNLPFPGWKHFKNAKDYMIITSRGCPYDCVFCMQASGKKVRKRSSGKVIEEIENVLKERKPERFLFYDETFTLDKRKVHELCDLLIKKGLNKKIKWSVTTRVDAVDRDILGKMKQAGCDHIEFGVESGNEEMLKRIKKGITKQQAEKAVSLAKEMGFHTEGAFILGHPHENMKTALETIDFAAKLNPDIVQLGIMVPYPGTEVREMALRREGGYKMLSTDWSEYNKQLGNALELDELSRPDLEKLQLAGYLRLFIYNRRYLDLFKFALGFWREMFSYFRNILRKRERTGEGSISYFQVLRLVFRKTILSKAR